MLNAEAYRHGFQFQTAFLVDLKVFTFTLQQISLNPDIEIIDITSLNK